jgi:homoserine O-succinyltransferase
LVQASTYGDSTAVSDDTSPDLTCAFVNNMPDGAFDATERQYLGLLEDGSKTASIELRRYTVPGVPRGNQTSARIKEQYFPLADIYRDAPDILIVTGSNPIEARIQDELYWDDLAELLPWGREHVRSTLLSCLAAHAALTILDGVDRIRLSAKCTGVFPQLVEVSHPLTAGLEREIVLPHSRWNTVPREALEQSGYDVLVHSEATSWGVASREEEGRQLLLVQGHPEYDPSSLLREYRRDADRFVHYERDDVPNLPYRCVSSDDWEQLERTHRDIVETRDPLLLDSYPLAEVAARAPWPWRSNSERFYRNWLTSVVQGKD